MLVRIIKNWDFPELIAQSPGSSGVIDGIRYTTEPVPECDYAIVLNTVQESVEVSCPHGHLWAVMQEPYIPGIFEWMVKGHERFSKVFTHHPPSGDSKYVTSYPMLPWHVQKSYDELVGMAVPQKTEVLSSIISNKAFFPGHQKRLKFVKVLREDPSLRIDMFGKGTRYIEDKWDALAPYKYSLAIENSRSRDYWTEKLADCFLAFTMPIYYGCENLEAYFPENSFIRIDIAKPQEALNIIKETIASGKWEEHLDAIVEARNLVLNKYNFYFNMTQRLKAQPESEGQEKERVVIGLYKRSLWERVRGKIKRTLHG